MREGGEWKGENVPFVFNGCKCGFYCGVRKLYRCMPHLIIVIDDFCCYDYLLTILVAEPPRPRRPAWFPVGLSSRLHTRIIGISEAIVRCDVSRFVSHTSPPAIAIDAIERDAT